VGRWATVGVLLLGFAYLPFILLQKNMIDAFTTLIPVFVTPLFTVYVLGAMTRVDRRSGLTGLLVGSAYGVFALYCREAARIPWFAELEHVPLWFVDRWGALGWSLLITAATMGVIHLIVRLWDFRVAKGEVPRADCAAGRDNLKDLSEDGGWLARSRESLPQICEHPFANRVPVWADPRIYAFVLLVVSVYVVFGLFW
jgi:solute:Na+ symporter, SSS family